MVLWPAASAIATELSAAEGLPAAICLQKGRRVSKLACLSSRPPLQFSYCLIIPPADEREVGALSLRPGAQNHSSVACV